MSKSWHNRYSALEICCAIFFAICACLLIFMCVDCSMGATKFYECIVADHIYKPSWTEVSVDTDSNGNPSVNTTVHDEEFHLICRESGGLEIFDCSESRAAYGSTTNDQPVTVRTRIGRFTGGRYLPRIDR